VWCACCRAARCASPGRRTHASSRWACSQALERADLALAQRPEADLPPERHFDDAGWVANRWCELLPIPLAARQQLMALPDPLQRLSLVDRFLRSKQLI
jgi:Lon protease-like protein